MPPCLIASHSQWFFDQFLAPALAACGDPPQVLRVDPQEGYPGLLQAFRQVIFCLFCGWCFCNR